MIELTFDGEELHPRPPPLIAMLRTRAADCRRRRNLAENAEAEPSEVHGLFEKITTTVTDCSNPMAVREPARFRNTPTSAVRRLWPIDSAATRVLVHVKEPIAPLSRASSIHLISSSAKRSFTHEQHFGVHAPCHTVRTRTILALLVPLFFLTHSIDDA